MESPYSRVQSLSSLWEDSVHRDWHLGNGRIEEHSNSSVYQGELTSPKNWKLESSPFFPCRQAPQEEELAWNQRLAWEAEFHEKGGSEATAYVCGHHVRWPDVSVSMTPAPGPGQSCLLPEPFSCCTKKDKFQWTVFPCLCCFLLSYLWFLYINSGLLFHFLLIWFFLLLPYDILWFWGYPYLCDVTPCVLTLLV